MRLHKADVASALAWRLPDGQFLKPDLFRAMGISSGQPILLDDDFRPGSLLSEYIRERNLDLQSESAAQYAYELIKFQNFLSEQGADVRTTTARHLHIYRRWRTDEQDSPIGPASWRRSASAIRGYLSWVAETENLSSTPADGGIFRSPLRGRPVADEKIRALTSDEWKVFRDFGIRGYSASSSQAKGRQLQNSGRLRLGAELALTTGMRLQEFSTLVLPEVVPRQSESLETVNLEACAKFGVFRTVFLVPRTRSLIDLYRRSERAAYAQRAVKKLERNFRHYFVVESVTSSSRVTGKLDGTTRHMQLQRIPPDLRRLMIHEGANGLEHSTLFLSRTGEPLGAHSWFRDFRMASERATVLGGLSGPRLRGPVKPHDLRHTFAIELLRHLMMKRRANGGIHTNDLQEHLVWNPVLTVQRMLGHRQPSTTLNYLRHIERLDGMLTDTWQGWEDPALTFSDYADFLEKGN